MKRKHFSETKKLQKATKEIKKLAPETLVDTQPSQTGKLLQHTDEIQMQQLKLRLD